MLEDSASAIPSSLWASINSWFTPTVLFVLLNLMIGTIFFTSSISNKKHPQKHDPHNSNPIARSPSVLQRLKSVNFYTHFRSQEPQDSSVLHKQNPDSDPAFNNFQSQEHYFFQHNSNQDNTDQTLHQSDTQTQTHYAFQHNLQESQTHFDFAEEKESKLDDDLQMNREDEQHEEESDEEGEQSMDEVYSQLSGDHHVSRTKSDLNPTAGEVPSKIMKKMKKSATMKSTFGHFEEEDIVEVRRPATARENGSAKAADADEGVDAKADDFINRFKQQLKLQRLDSIIRYKDMIGRGK